MVRLIVLVSGLLFALCGNAFGDLATDRAALVELYDATHGDQWVSKHPSINNLNK